MREKRRRMAALVLLAAMGLTALTACGGGQDGEESSTPAAHGETETPPPVVTPTATPVPTQTPPPEKLYDFSQPVPETGEAGEDYFADAVFIGDSRTDGFLMYSGVKGATGIVHTGLSIFGALDEAVIKQGEKKITVLEALAQEEYTKVYICLGVNELGYKDDQKFYEAYGAFVDAVRAVQPGAVIYLQNLIPLNEEQVKRDYLRNEHLRDYNALIAQVAEEKQVALVDLYSAFVDESGQLPKEASSDGVHMKRSYCEKWLAYLRSHTVTEEEMGIQVEQPPRETETALPVPTGEETIV